MKYLKLWAALTMVSFGMFYAAGTLACGGYDWAKWDDPTRHALAFFWLSLSIVGLVTAMAMDVAKGE